MPEPELTLQMRRKLVAAAILLAEIGLRSFIATEADPSADSDDRGAAREFRDRSTTTGRPLRSIALIAWTEFDAGILEATTFAGVLIPIWFQR